MRPSFQTCSAMLAVTDVPGADSALPGAWAAGAGEQERLHCRGHKTTTRKVEVWDSPPLVVIVKIMRQDRDVVVEADTWYKGSQLGCHLSDSAKEFGIRNGLLSAEEGANLCYELAAIVKHFGTPGDDNPAEHRSGHYNVLIRVVGTDEYWTADDETVTNESS